MLKGLHKESVSIPVMRAAMVRVMAGLSHDEGMALLLLTNELVPTNCNGANVTVATMQEQLALRLIKSFDRMDVRSFLHLMVRYPFNAEDGVVANAGDKMDEEVQGYVTNMFRGWLAKKVAVGRLHGFNSVILRMVQRFLMDRGAFDYGRILQRIVSFWENTVKTLAEDRRENRIDTNQLFCAMAGHHWLFISISLSALPLAPRLAELEALLRKPVRGAMTTMRLANIPTSEMGADFLVAFPDVDESLPRLVQLFELMQRVLGREETERWIMALCRRPEWAAVLLRFCCDARFGTHKSIRATVVVGLKMFPSPAVANLAFGKRHGLAPAMRSISLALMQLDAELLLLATKTAAQILDFSHHDFTDEQHGETSDAILSVMRDVNIFYRTGKPILIRQQRLLWSQFHRIREEGEREGGGEGKDRHKDRGSVVALTLALGVLFSETLSRGPKRNHGTEWCGVVDRVVGEIFAGILPFNMRGWPEGHAEDSVNRWGVVREAFPSLALLFWRLGGDKGKSEVRDVLSGSNILRHLQRTQDLDSSSPTSSLGKRTHTQFSIAECLDSVGGSPDDLFKFSALATK